MLNSKEFRGNIHSAINGGLNHEPKSKLIMASKQMSKFLLNQPLWTSAISLPRTDNSVIVPINDINSIASTDLSEYEQLIRCKLASVYRLIDLLRCSQGIYNHVTVSASSSINIYYYFT
jgi:adducin